MSPANRESGRTAEVRWGGQPAAVVWIGERTLHSFWPILAPYFRDVLLPPHRRDEEQLVAWHWTEVPGAPTARELAALRQRLRRDAAIYTEAMEAEEKPAPSGEQRGAADRRGLVPAVRGMVDALGALADAELADRVARTGHGLRLHSWGASTSGVVGVTGGHSGTGRPDAGAAPATPPLPALRPTTEQGGRGARRRRRAAGAGVAVAVTLAAAWWWLRWRTDGTAQMPPSAIAARDVSDSGEPNQVPRRALVYADDRHPEMTSEPGLVIASTGGEPRLAFRAPVAAGAGTVADGTVARDRPVRAGGRGEGDGAGGDIESSRDVAVTRDTARPAPGSPVAGSSVVAAGRGLAVPPAVAGLPAGAAAVAPVAAGATTAGNAGVAGDGEAKEGTGPRSRPGARRGQPPPVSPPGAVGSSPGRGQAADSGNPAAAPDPAVRPAVEAGRSGDPGQREVVSEEQMRSASTGGPATGTASVGAGPAEDAVGRLRARRGRLAGNRPDQETDGAQDGGTVPLAAAAGESGGPGAERAAPAVDRLMARWRVAWEPGGTQRLRAVILPTLPMAEDDGESIEALRARVSRDVRASCPTELQAPRWRQAVVVAATEGEVGSGWSWRVGPGPVAAARTGVAEGRGFWEAPAVASDAGGVWTLVDARGRARAEVEARADGELMVTIAPGMRIWQRLALAAVSDAGGPAKRDFAWDSPSGGGLPPACVVVNHPGGPAGGWIELPLADDRTLVPDTLALVDAPTGWAALVHRRAGPAALTAPR